MKYIFVFLICCIAPSISWAMIDITPQKIVMETRDRSGEFTILNLYKKTGTFRIELLNYEQNENGIYKKLDTPLNPDFNPKRIVRFSPRQFTLPPGGRQKIRLSLRKPSDLPEGEYRFHVKAYRFSQEEEQSTNQSSGSINISTNMGVVIPVVVRHGKTFSDAKIHNASFVDAQQGKAHKKELHLDILREGSASTVGKLEVIWKRENNKKEKIGEISNANVFTDVEKRNFKIPLLKTPNDNGVVFVRYFDAIKEEKIFDEVVLNY